MFQSQPNRHISSRSKILALAGPTCAVFREGCDKKRHKFKKKFRVRERHILPRNVTNVMVTFFVTKKSDKCDVDSDVVKVKGEDPDTPGYLKGDRVRLGRR